MTVRASVPGSFALLGLCLSCTVGAVQLPAAQLPVDRPLLLPTWLPLTGLDSWRLQGVFYQQGGGGWLLLNTDQLSTRRVEPGALVQDGIYLDSLERDGAWFVRGHYRAYLRMSGSLQTTEVLPTYLEPSAETAGEVLSDRCQGYRAGGVPQEELSALGICPKAR